MDFQYVINNILKPKAAAGRYYKPAVTVSGGIKQDFLAPRPGRRHRAVDINYHHNSGAPVGQNEINLTHPDVGSPVSGKVTRIDHDIYGMIQITDERGFAHEIRHLDYLDPTLNKGSYVKAGQIIGTMGGRGPAGVNQFQQHVHYAVKTDNDMSLDPVAFWNSYHGTAYVSDRPARPARPATLQGFQNREPLIITPSRHTRVVIGAESPSAGSHHGGSLRRDRQDYRVVHRIEEDGSLRGYFISE